MSGGRPDGPFVSRSLAIVRDYHRSTKHRPGRYARSLGYLDWDTQPDPFRRFTGADQIRLDEVSPTRLPSYDALFRAGAIVAAPLNGESLSRLLYDSLALSAWKAYGDHRWSLRVNPSSGNLHPTEGYLLLPPVEGFAPTPLLCHYAPYEHALEIRRQLTADDWNALTSGLPRGTLLFGLSSIHWRESWKYGERAYRYCQHDVGHAIGAIAVAARALGWGACLLPTVSDGDLAVLLGVSGQSGIEAEHPDCLLAVTTDGTRLEVEAAREFHVEPTTIADLRNASPVGTPNRLSQEHHEWPIIDVVARATTLDEPVPTSFWEETADERRLPTLVEPPPARAVIRRRRSAVAMDGRTRITQETFFRMMRAVSPGRDRPPFDALPWRPRMHLVLFVHRVEGVEPGVYFLVRRGDETRSLKAAMRPDFAWHPVGEPPSGDLYLLERGDARQVARAVSCGQDIASDGAFAVAMLAEFDRPLAEYGAWFYRHLHWEAGALGQLLYLEAEAAGARATGIGCFFDDLVHELLGLEDTRYQSLYHFTVGGAVDDPRLRTEPAYAHRAG